MNPIMLNLSFISCTIPSQMPKDRFIDQNAQKLSQAIEGLPFSPLKEMLRERVYPYYTSKAPFILTRGRLDIVVHGSVVDFHNDQPSGVFKGFFSYMDRHCNPPIYYPTQDTTLKFPLVGSVLPTEINRFPAENISPDGTVIINVEFKKDDIVTNGAGPSISIHKPASVSAQLQPWVNAMEKFTLVKEAFGLALEDVLIEETVRKMRRLGLPTHMLARNNDGEEFQIEAVNRAHTLIHDMEGRTNALIDIPPYVLATKAFEGTGVLKQISGIGYLQPLIAALRGVNFGNNSRTIMYSCFKWSIENPSLTEPLPHVGNMRDLP